MRMFPSPMLAAVLALTSLAACNADSTRPLLAPAFDLTALAGGPSASLIFHSARDGNFEIYTMNPDGSNPIRITNDSGEDIWPDLSPDGRHAVYASNRSGNREILVQDLATGTVTNISQSPADDNWPRFSPNGRTVVFHSNRDGNYEIYIARADGAGSPRRATNNALLDQWPDWSPDGRLISFRRGMDIFVIDSNGEEMNPRQLTNLPATLDQMPAWAPNGKQLAFMSFREGYCAVYLMSADGDTPANPAVNLTPKDPADPSAAWCSRAPAWARNGKQIYFMTFRPATGGSGAAFNEIYVMNADGSAQTRLTTVAREDGGPQAR